MSAEAADETPLLANEEEHSTPDDVAVTIPPNTPVHVHNTNNNNNNNESDTSEESEYVPPAVRQQARLWRVYRFANGMFIAYHIVLSCALVWCLLTAWHKPCDSPLEFWVVVQLALQMMVVANSFALQKALRVMPAGELERAYRLQTIRTYYSKGRVITFFYLLWLMVQTLWVSKAESCSYTNPTLYGVVFTVLVIHVTMCGLVMLGWCCGMCVLTIFVIRHPELLRHAEVAEPEKVGLTPTALEALESRPYSPTGPISPDDAMCAICLEYYEESETLRILPCKHHFHQECIDEWLSANRACPYCKHNADEPMDTAGPAQ